MKKLIYTTITFFLAGSLSAQVLKNEGAFIGALNGAYIGFENLINDTDGTISIDGSRMHLDNDLQNSGTFVLNGNLDVSGNLVNDGTFTLLTNASLIDGGSITGNDFDVQKNVLGNGPKYLSSPVSGALAEVFTGAFVYSYDENNSEWNPITSGSSALSTLTGYSVEYQNDATLTFQGRPNTASVNRSLSNAGDGWNLVGNPYPSALDWDNDAWTKTNVGNSIYMWDATNQNYTTYLGSATEAGIAVNVDEGTDASIIPKMQAFFVKAFAASPALAVTNDARLHSFKEIVGNARVSGQEVFAKIKIGNNTGFEDELLVRLSPFATNQFDPEWDAYKLKSPNPEVPAFYSYTSEREPMAINSMVQLGQETIVSLGFEAQVAGSYTIDLVEADLDGLELFLVDKEKGTTIDLTDSDYAFNSAASSSDRFELYFLNTVTGFHRTKNGVKVYALNDGILIKNSVNQASLRLKIYDLKGRLLSSLSDALQVNESHLVRPELSPGLYLIQGYIDGEVFKSKMFIK